MKFFLGSHHTHWLGTVPVSLCLSRRQLVERKTFPRALAPWLLDSGGFTELTLNGRWTVSVPEYVAQVRTFARESGQLEYAAPQDWMCVPDMLQRTGRSVQEHQDLTVANYLDLLQAAPELPWFPVLQGWEPDEYLRHADQYERAGVDLKALPLVGVGTVCRRQHTDDAERILRTLAARGLRLHGFGLKTLGLLRSAHVLYSADSLSWSFRARRMGRELGHNWCGSTAHKNCANCPAFALDWRANLLAKLVAPRHASRQLTLWDLP